MGTYTTNKELFMPSIGEQGWGELVNGNFETIDTYLKPISLSGSTYTFTGNHVGNQSGGSISATSITNSGTLTQTGTSTFMGQITASEKIKGNLSGFLFVPATIGEGSPTYAYASSVEVGITYIGTSPLAITIPELKIVATEYTKVDNGIYIYRNDVKGELPTTCNLQFYCSDFAGGYYYYKKEEDSEYQSITAEHNATKYVEVEYGKSYLVYTSYTSGLSRYIYIPATGFSMGVDVL